VQITSLPLLTALVAGFAHALEADHMAAVTAFVSRRPHPLRALGFGVRWGLGHSLALLVAGAGVILLDLQISEALVRGLELGVGVMLIGLGAWAIWSILHLRTAGAAHRRAHEHLHPHSHSSVGGTTWVGAFHGLAGTAGFLALVPVALLSSPWLAGGYLLLFGAGTVAAMGLYALLAGLLFDRIGSRAPGLGVGLRALTAVASAVIGAFWMSAALG
jgi:hypothetical protein